MAQAPKSGVMEDETESEESDRDDGEDEVDNPANEEAAKREEVLN